MDDYTRCLKNTLQRLHSAVTEVLARRGGSGTVDYAWAWDHLWRTWHEAGQLLKRRRAG